MGSGGGGGAGCRFSLALFRLPGRLWTCGRETAVLNRDRQSAGTLEVAHPSPVIQAQRRQVTWGREQQVCVGTRPAGFSLPFPSKFFARADRVSKTPSGLSNSCVFILVS